MKTEWHFLMVLALLAALVVVITSPAQAQVGISDVDPLEGTVGTEVTISGSGFGDKHGEVLIGTEKCKVLEWGEAVITCVVHKPQPAGLYAVTVIPREGEPITFQAFTMRRPHLLPEGWAWDGKTVTLTGQFLGDKKGDIFFVVPDGQVETAKVVEAEAKVVDWSMDTVRFKIPRGLSGYRGDYILVVVANQVGRGGLFLSLSGGIPTSTEEYAHNFGLSHDNVSGIQVDVLNVPNLHFAAFYPCAEGACNHDNEIRGWNVFVHPLGYLDIVTFSDQTGTPFPLGQTDTAVVPLVIAGKLWLFFSGHDGGLYYARYDGTSWDGWQRIEPYPSVSTNSDWEIAPVYNPTTHLVEIYYEYYQMLYRVYSDDYGETWVRGGQVTGVGNISQAPSAVFYSQTNSVLLAVGVSNQANVFSIQNGAVVGTRTSFGTVHGRPFLADLNSTYQALTWHTESGGVPYISKMNKSTGGWEKPYQPIPDQGSAYPPSIAVWNGKFYLMWGRSRLLGTDAVMEAFY